MLAWDFAVIVGIPLLAMYMRTLDPREAATHGSSPSPQPASPGVHRVPPPELDVAAQLPLNHMPDDDRDRTLRLESNLASILPGGSPGPAVASIVSVLSQTFGDALHIPLLPTPKPLSCADKHQSSQCCDKMLHLCCPCDYCTTYSFMSFATPTTAATGDVDGREDIRAHHNITF